MKKSLHIIKEGGNRGKLLEFQRAQLQRLELEEPLSEETRSLLELTLQFITEAQKLTKVPLKEKVEAQKQITALKEKMALLNQVSATGKELLLRRKVG